MKKAIATIFAILLLTALSLPVTRNAEQGPLTEIDRSEAPGQFVRLSGGDVLFELQGPEDGPVVVFIHGFSVPSYTWERNAAFLAQRGYRVLSFDLYGRGYSARPDLSYDRMTFVNQVAELLDALGIGQQVTLVGISMGGAIVAAFAAEHPAKVERLVLLAPFNRPIDIGPLKTPVLGEYLGYAFYVPDLPEKQRGDFVTPAAQDEWVDRYRVQMQYDGFRRAILATARHFIQSDPSIDFETVGAAGMPTLLLWGDSDSTFPAEQSQDVLKALGDNARYHLVPGAGHALHYEKADKINDLIAAFLERDASVIEKGVAEFDSP